jgi:hypothetical protein
MTALADPVVDQKTDPVNPSTLSARAARRLIRRTPLELDARGMFAIKRNVHEWEVEADADALAAALRAVAADPGESFGIIRLRRLPERVGRPFEAGERFHGCLPLAGVAPRLARGLAAARLPGVTRWIEDTFLSDYAEVVTLEDRLVRYRYLSGTPIAGSSTLRIEPLGPGRARVVAIFEFQEVKAAALGALHGFALRAHDEALDAQVNKSAARAGGRVIRRTLSWNA